ncbi:response regulator [Bdellovibrio sp. HCB209]|uniref:response regulator n=1 Tax=Bdellovibrio sp. HCB209 TaxID=3394354 RepID=UPI0039B47089
MNTQPQFCALIVDDQIDSTMVLKTMMENRGFKCYHALTAEEATKRIEEVLPHLLIVDVNLGPDISGLEWLVAVRKGVYGFIPAVMLTGSGDETTVKDSMQLGIYDYVIKPSNASILDKKITSWIQRLKEGVYRLDAEQMPIPVEASFDMQILAISETGLCVAGVVANAEPLTFTKVSSPLFQGIDVTQPQRITFLNYEKNPAGAINNPIRNFCQVSGWTEPDFKRIRLWIRSNGLGRNF